MKKKLIFLVCATLAYLVIFSILSRREVNHELIRPIPEEPMPTPTIQRKPRPAPEHEEVSWYGQEYCKAHNPDCITASLEPFDENALTCACNYTYPLGTRFRVSYRDRSVVVRCNDRGNFKKYQKTLDLSKGAFEKLAPTDTGVLRVSVEKLK